MPANVQLSAGMLFSFLAVLARVSGAVVFIPLPGLRSGPDIARIVFSIGLVIALYPAWPAVAAGNITTGSCVTLLLSEAAFGVVAGLSVAFLMDSFVLAAQILGLQAGFSYSSTIDPSSQADSTVLQVFIQLASGLLFFACGIHHHVIRAFAASLETVPPGAFSVTSGLLPIIIKLGTGMFSLGMRLAMPVVALLLLIDIALALMGRIMQALYKSTPEMGAQYDAFNQVRLGGHAYPSAVEQAHRRRKPGGAQDRKHQTANPGSCQ